MNDHARLSLDGDWTLYYAPEVAGKSDTLDMSALDTWTRIDARVPGNVEIDLTNAGIGEDPFHGTNLYTYAEYEYYQWLYYREVSIPADFAARNPGSIMLRFNGLDTIADIYVNDSLIGSTANMFIEHEFDITAAVRPNEVIRIAVHIHSAMNFARSQEYTMAMRGTDHRNEICRIRKAPHCFGWDIAPRLVSAGIWRSVELYSRPATRITEAYYATPELDREGIYLEYGYRFVTDADTLEGFSVRIHGTCEDSSFSHELPAHFVSANHGIFIRDPKLWWPAGYGDAPLYEVSMKLLRHGVVVDERSERIGLRVVEFERSFEPADQEFKFSVNGIPIMAKGTNWVPLDALHSRDTGRLSTALALLAESGSNIVRCWGGNVYEDHPFFDFCDAHGIMVWQDFAMGNTNYPQSDEFVPVIEAEASSIIRKLRNHPSLIIWSGDNEIDTKNMGFRYPHYDSRHNRVAHETLVRLVQAHDPYRYFLRSSPEIPAGFHTDDVPEQHMWGPRAYYKDDFYKHCTAHFIGEAGYHGCPDPASIARFIPSGDLWPFENDSWAAHSTEDIRITPEPGGRNRLMANQVHLLFGERPDDLRRFSILSQLSQAESVKFFVERTRVLKWRRTGIIWWNLLDCWPQISDAVVDYYFTKKLAFHYLKRSQLPVCMILDEPSGWSHEVVLANDTRKDLRVNWCVQDGEDGSILLEGAQVISPANENIVLGDIATPASMQKLVVMKWTVDGTEYANHYVSGFPPFDPDRFISWLEIIRSLPERF